ncbi:hypothetical protein ACFLS9_08615, partial [Bacteroidota bacterium]
MSLEKFFKNLCTFTLFLIILATSTLNAKTIYVSATNGQTGANGSQLSGIFPDVPVPTFTEALALAEDGDEIVVTADDYLADNETITSPFNAKEDPVINEASIGWLVISKSVTFKAMWLTTNPTKLFAVLKFQIAIDGDAIVGFESFDDKGSFVIECYSEPAGKQTSITEIRFLEYVHVLKVKGTLDIGTYNPTSKLGAVNAVMPALHINAGPDNSDLHFYFDGNSIITGNPPTLENDYDIFLEWEGASNVVSGQETKIVNEGSAGNLRKGAVRVEKGDGTTLTIGDDLSFDPFSDGDDFGWYGSDVSTGAAIEVGNEDANNNAKFASLDMKNNDIFNDGPGTVTIGSASEKLPAINQTETVTFTGAGTNCKDYRIGQLESDDDNGQFVVNAAATWTIDEDGADWEDCDLPIIRNGGTGTFTFNGDVLVEPNPAIDSTTICHVSNQMNGVLTFNGAFQSIVKIIVNFWNASETNFIKDAYITGDVNNNYEVSVCSKSEQITSAAGATINFHGMTTILGFVDNDGGTGPGWPNADNIINVESPNGQLHVTGYIDNDADHAGPSNSPSGTGTCQLYYKSGPNSVGGNLDNGHTQSLLHLFDNVMVTVSGKYQAGDALGAGGTAKYGEGSVLELDGGIPNHSTNGGVVVMTADPPPTGSNLGTGYILVSGADAGCDGGAFPGLKIDSVAFTINANPVDFRGPVSVTSTLNLNVNAVANNDWTIGNNFDDPGDPAVVNLNTPGCTSFTNVFDDIVTGFNPKFTLNGDGTFNTDPVTDGIT